MNLKKTLAFALSLSMAASMAGCGGTGSAPSAAPSTAPDSQPSAPVVSDNGGGATGEQVTIKWWAFPTFGVDSGYEEEVIAAFEKANPDVKVELTTIDFTSGPEQLTSAITAGTAPDILFDAPGRIIEYGNAGNLVALDDMFDSAYLADVTNQGVLEACKGAGGTYYMYPISSSPFYMGLNKEALVSSGAIEFVNLEGDRTWTTEDFQNMCAKLAENGATAVPGIVYCGGQGGDQGTRALVNNLYSSTIVGSDGKWNIDANGVKALQLLADMYSKGHLDAGFSMAAADELQQFQQETAAMTFCWGTSNEVSYATEDFTQEAVPFPSDDGVPELEYLVNGFCVFDNKDAARADAAKRFLKFICDDSEWGPQSVIKTNAFPVRDSFGDLYPGDEHKALLASWTQYYGPYYNTKDGFATMRPLWFNMLQNVFNGNDVQAEADNFNTQANA